MNTFSFAAMVLLCAATSAAGAAATPAVGDTYVYRVINGYSKEERGRVAYRVDKVDGDRVTVSVTTDISALGIGHTELVTREGNWLRHPVVNRNEPVDYEFASAFPAYVFPLEPRRSWSVRLNAVNPSTGRRNSVRVDGKVIGAEKVSVPAGSFDAIKVTRRVYAGDWDGPRHETNIIETDWYVPQLGRAVRSEITSGYLNVDQCQEFYACVPIRGDWHVLELVEARSAAR